MAFCAHVGTEDSPNVKTTAKVVMMKFFKAYSYAQNLWLLGASGALAHLPKELHKDCHEQCEPGRIGAVQLSLS